MSTDEQRERQRQALVRRLLAQNTADINRCRVAIALAFDALMRELHKAAGSGRR